MYYIYDYDKVKSLLKTINNIPEDKISENILYVDASGLNDEPGADEEPYTYFSFTFKDINIDFSMYKDDSNDLRYKVLEVYARPNIMDKSKLYGFIYKETSLDVIRIANEVFKKIITYSDTIMDNALAHAIQDESNKKGGLNEETK